MPAAGSDWALPLYDPLVKLMGAQKIRRILLEQAALQHGYRVLDIGCGTGTFAISIKQRYPNVEVVGLDPDPKALARAARKAKRARVAVQFDRGFADELPYANDSFDRVLSSFMFHHLHSEVKEATLREVRRVLAPSGSLHLADFEQSGGLMGAHMAAHLKDSTEKRLVAFMQHAGLAASRTGGAAILLGMLHYGYYKATKA